LTQKIVRNSVRRFFAQAGLPPHPRCGAVISSVVPGGTKSCTAVLRRHFGVNPLIVSAKSASGMRIRYQRPAGLGADRICGAAAAYARHGGPVIVVDAGTATTYGVVSAHGIFLGGAISPGVRTSALALRRSTARLPAVQLRFPASVIGTSTVAGMQSGTLYGALDAMEGMIRRLKRVAGSRAKVILTGGFSRLLGSKSRSVDAVEPYLVLEGARMIFERSRLIRA
jgi:type III pantothenate kinase